MATFKAFFSLIACSLISGYIFTSCTEENLENDSKFEYRIDDEVSGFLEKFYLESEARGVQILKENLAIDILDNVSLNGNTVCALSGFNHVFPQRYIEIDRGCWESISEEQKEIVLFHELGHSLLGRKHNLEKLPNNKLKSLMYPILGGKNFYEVFVERRKYYLDELFDASTLVPEWGNLGLEKVLVKDNIIADTNSWQLLGGSNFSSGENVNSQLLLHRISNQMDTDILSWSLIIDAKDYPHEHTLILEYEIKFEDIKGREINTYTIGTLSDEKVYFNNEINYSQTDISQSSFKKFQLVMGSLDNQVDQVQVFFNIFPSTSGSFTLQNLKIYETF